MQSLKESKPDDKELHEKFELAYRLLERTDTLRSSAANRAAIILSADALLVAGITFLVDKALLSGTQYSVTEYIFLATSFSVTSALIILSAIFAVNAITTIWQRSDTLIRRPAPKRLFFHLRDTSEGFKDFEDFEHHFRNTDISSFTTYALSEYWRQIHLHGHQITNFRRATKMFILSVIAYIISVAIFAISTL